MPTYSNLTKSTGKKTLYIRTSYPGVCFIYEWSKAKKRYARREQGLRYYAYRKIGQIQRSKCLESYEQAKKWRDTGYLETEIQKTKKLTFAQIKEKFFEHKKGKVKPSTLETYQVNTRHLTFFDMMPVSEITAKVLDHWLVTVKKPEYLAMQNKSRLSYEHELEVLRQILSFYSEYVDDAYVVPIKKRHRKDCIIDMAKYKEAKARNEGRYISRLDCDRFLKALERNAKKQETEEKNLKERLYYLLAFLHLRVGLRVGEACALNWKNVNLKTGELTISKTVVWSRKKGRSTYISPTTKSGKSRQVEIMDEELLRNLRDWRLKSGRSQGLIFSMNGEEPLAYRSIQQKFDRTFKCLGLSHRSTHILRHSFATDFLEVTGDQNALKEILGHSDLRQTEHYAKVTNTLKKRAAQTYRESFRSQTSLGEAG